MLRFTDVYGYLLGFDLESVTPLVTEQGDCLVCPYTERLTKVRHCNSSTPRVFRTQIALGSARGGNGDTLVSQQRLDPCLLLRRLHEHFAIPVFACPRLIYPTLTRCLLCSVEERVHL